MIVQPHLGVGRGGRTDLSGRQSHRYRRRGPRDRVFVTGVLRAGIIRAPDTGKYAYPSAWTVNRVLLLQDRGGGLHEAAACVLNKAGQ
jgi:hypothetical protein